MVANFNSDRILEDNLHIIAIGASAGGLEALQDFLTHLPPLDDVCIIIAQHLSPTHKSLLVQLLSKQTQLRVIEAADGMPLETDSVYITPPDNEITIHEGKIHLGKPSSLVGPKPSVDILFRSLNNLTEHKIIAIVLSGTGSDGALGLESLEGDNILKVAQDPSSAKYDGMPNAAIQKGATDIVLRPEEMGNEIKEFLFNPDYLIIKQTEKQDNNFSSFEKILKELGKSSGTDFSNYKTPTLMRRLEKRMQALHFEEMGKYLEYLKKNPKEVDELFNMMLIGVTNFFRDKDAFQSLKISLAKLLENKNENEPIRFWVPGCSTGEEAYTLAIIVNELLGKTPGRFNLQIFGTDIDDRAIQFARKGIYSASSLEGVPAELREKYFLKKGDEFELIKKIRSKVLFSKHDVIRNPPFLRLDLISCRNLLIYFNTALQQHVLPIFHYALNDEGLLFLGKSETIGQFSDLFGTLDSKDKVYQRKRGGNINAIKFSALKPNITSLNRETTVVQKNISLTDRIKETLYTSYEHPFVIIDQDYDIQEVFGDVRLFMSLPSGMLNVNLLKMVNQELQIELRSILARIVKENQEIRSSIKKFILFEREYYVKITAKPLVHADSSQALYMVIFENLDLAPFLTHVSPGDQVTIDNTRIKELEQELNHTKEHLQVYIEEIETSNEELQSLNEEMQSTNEELQSSNEELETTNEELQSTNEEIQIAYAELKTAHQELAEKDEKLQELQANTQALLNNNLQAFILVDANYQIMAHNEEAIHLFEIISGSSIKTGVSIIDYLPTGDVEHFIRDFRQIFSGSGALSVAERSISFGQEIKYLSISYTPVEKADGSIDSVSIGIIDITEKKRIELEIENTSKRLENLLNTQTHYVLRTDLEGRHTYWNQVFEDDYGWAYEGKGIDGSNGLESICEHDHHKAYEAAEFCIANPGKVYKVELDKPSKNGGIRSTLWEFMCIVDQDGNPYEMQCMGIEVTDINRMRESERLLNEAQRLSKMGSWNFDFRKDLLTWSESLYDVFDVDRETFKETHGSFLSLIDEEYRDKALETSKNTQETGDPFHIIYRITTPKGEKRWVEEFGYADKDEEGKIVRLYGTAQNVTERIQTEEKLRSSDRIFNYSLDLLCIASLDGYFKVLNPAWSNLLGYTEEELLSKPFIHWVHPDDIERTENAKTKLVGDKIILQFENRYRCKDGSYKWLSWNSYPYPEEGILYAVARDISENKKKEEELRKLSKAVEQSSASIVITNSQGDIEYVNPKFSEITGYSLEDVLEKNPRILKSGLQSDEFYQIMWESIASGKSWSGQLYNKKKDGSYYWESAIISPIIDAEGKITHYIAIKEDITHKKESEELLRKSEEKHKIVAENTFNWEFWDGPDGLPIYISPSVEKISGYTADEIMLLPELLLEMVHPEDKEFYLSHKHNTYEHKKHDACLFRIKHKDGSVKYIEHFCKPVYSDFDEFLGIRGSNVDVTERFLYEQKLRESERRFRQIFETLPNISVQGYDENRNIIYWNKASELVYGFTEDEVKGRKLEEVMIPDEMKDHVTCAIRNWIEKDVPIPSEEMWLQHKNGQLIPVFSNHILVENNDGKKELYCVDIDLSDIKKAQNELKLSEERYRSIINVSNTGAWEYDMSTGSLWVSPEYLLMLGYENLSDLGQTEPTGFSLWSNLVCPEDFKKAEKVFMDYCKGDMTSEYENYFRLMHKDGSHVWVWSRGRNLKNEDGSPTSIILGTHIDITELKKTEQELKNAYEHTKLLQEALDNVPVVVYMKNRDGNYTYGNKTIQELFGISATELMGASDALFFDKKTVQKIQLADQEVLMGKDIQRELKTVNHAGQTRHYLEIKSPLYEDGDSKNIIGILGMATDITELKKAQETVQQSELYYKSMLRALPDLMFVISKDYIYLDYRANNKDLFVQPDAFLNKKIHEVMPDDLAHLLQESINTALAEKKLQEIEYELPINGQANYYNARIVSFGPDKVIVLVRNITEAKINLDQIKKLLSLEEEQNKRLINFTHIVSHNLRSHTSNMQSIFLLMEAEEEEILQNIYVSMIKESADNLNQTLHHLNEVLDISQNLDSKYAETSIYESVQSAIKTINQIAVDSEVKIINKINDPNLNIYAVPAYLESIVLNLISNAIKFSDPSKESYVKIYARKAKSCIMIAVEDNGIGIDLKLHGHKLFGMYKTFHDNKNSKGLGLFISRNQAEAMKGTIRVSSKVGVGSTFRLYLPLRTDEMLKIEEQSE